MMQDDESFARDLQTQYDAENADSDTEEAVSDAVYTVYETERAAFAEYKRARAILKEYSDAKIAILDAREAGIEDDIDLRHPDTDSEYIRIEALVDRCYEV